MTEVLRQFRRHEVPSDGNCFYESMAMVMQSAGIHCDQQVLREVVARTVLNQDDAQVTAAISTWMVMLRDAVREQDASLIQQYPQVRDVYQEEAVTPHVRQLIYRRMLESSFWANEYVLDVLQRKLKVLIVVVPRHEAPWWTFADKQEPFDYFTVLSLRHQHYEPMSFENRFLFNIADLHRVVDLE